MATPPTKVNTGAPRSVTGSLVINADDPNVEREQLNRILKNRGSGIGAQGPAGADGANGADGEDGIAAFEGATAGEALSAGEFVSVDASGEIVLADGSTNDLLASGFVKSDYPSGATNVRVYYVGENTHLSGLTPGDQHYLSDTVPGGVTDTPPTGNSPKVIQQLGIATSATTMIVNIQQAIELPA